MDRWLDAGARLVGPDGVERWLDAGALLRVVELEGFDRCVDAGALARLVGPDGVERWLDVGALLRVDEVEALLRDDELLLGALLREELLEYEELREELLDEELLREDELLELLRDIIFPILAKTHSIQRCSEIAKSYAGMDGASTIF